jgi:hypothetical protein
LGHDLADKCEPGDKKSDWLIVGGEDHKTGEADDADRRFQMLEAWPRSLVPALKTIEYRWSGQVFDTIDYLPFSGRNPGNESVLCIPARPDERCDRMVQNRKHRWAGILDPSRKTAKSVTRYATENLSIAAKLAEYVTPGDVASVEEISPGQGAIVRKGLHKIAAFRDLKCKPHLRSAT